MSEDLGTGFLAECFSMGVEAFVDWYDHLPARRVMYIIKNSTKETLYRTAYIPNHGAWVEDGPWVFPWETIPPGATLKCCLQLSGGHLDLQGKIAYKRAKDSDDLFRVHIKCPEHGPNEYFDTSLSEWANKEYYFKEMTPFRQNILGTASRQVTAAFLLGDFPFPHLGTQKQAEVGHLIRIGTNPSTISLNDKMYCFYGTGSSNAWVEYNEVRLLYSVYELAGSDWVWREGKPCDGTSVLSSPSAVVFQDRVYIFYRGPDATLRYVILDGQEAAESEITIKGTFLSCSPSAVVFDDKIWVAFQSREKNSEMYYVTMDKDGNFTQGVRFWHNWCSESPCLTTTNGRLWCYHQGAGNDGTLWSCEWTNNEFGSTRKINNTFLSDSPSVIIANEKTHVFHRASGDGRRLWCDTYDMSGKSGAGWTGDIEMPDTWLQGSPCTLIFRGRIYIVHRGDDNCSMWYRHIED